MKYKVTIPFHWYAGEAHYQPRILSCSFDALEEAREVKNKLNAAYSAEDEEKNDLEVLLEKHFGVFRDGFMDGAAELYEIGLRKIE